LIASASGKAVLQQNKPYCQLCFKEFNLLVRKFHCIFCGRSCCSNCSDETLPELKLIDSELVPTVDKPLQNIANFFAKSQQKQQAAKVCEYCFVKITNP